VVGPERRDLALLAGTIDLDPHHRPIAIGMTTVRIVCRIPSSGSRTGGGDATMFSGSNTA